MSAINIINIVDNYNKSFKYSHSYEDRLKDSTQIRVKYPDRIPVICEKNTSIKKNTLNQLYKKKYLVPMDFSLAQFMFLIRKNIKIAPNEAIFLCIGHIIPPTNSQFIYLYEQYRDADGFLYVTYTAENTFGK